jgi:hypothetical protein
MNIVTIYHMKLNRHTNEREPVILDSVERPESMSIDAVALAWAMSEGYEDFPTDCKFAEAKFIPYGEIAIKNTPFSDQEELERRAQDIGTRQKLAIKNRTKNPFPKELQR